MRSPGDARREITVVDVDATGRRRRRARGARDFETWLGDVETLKNARRCVHGRSIISERHFYRSIVNRARDTDPYCRSWHPIMAVRTSPFEKSTNVSAPAPHENQKTRSSSLQRPASRIFVSERFRARAFRPARRTSAREQRKLDTITFPSHSSSMCDERRRFQLARKRR